MPIIDPKTPPLRYVGSPGKNLEKLIRAIALEVRAPL